MNLDARPSRGRHLLIGRYTTIYALLRWRTPYYVFIVPIDVHTKRIDLSLVG